MGEGHELQCSTDSAGAKDDAGSLKVRYNESMPTEPAKACADCGEDLLLGPCPCDYDWESEVGTCSICDALGHGFPGGGPCPLEDRGWEDAERDRLHEAGLR